MDRKNKSASLINILLVCLSLVCGVMVFYVFQQNSLSDQNLTYISKLEEEIKDYKQKISDVSNIEEKINEQKETYYNDIVKLEQDIKDNKSNKKIAYITIDDGPYELTHEFLKVLKQYNVKATFFTLMKPDRKEIYKKILAEGHTIGNHTATHDLSASGIYSSTSKFVNNIRTLEKWLNDEFNYQPTLYRFPGGAATAGNLKEPIVNALKEDYKYVQWNVDVGDGSSAAMEVGRPYEYFLSQIESQDIALILMHDYSEKTIEDLPKIIEYLIEHDYMILPLTNKSTMVN